MTARYNFGDFFKEFLENHNDFLLNAQNITPQQASDDYIRIEESQKLLGDVLSVTEFADEREICHANVCHKEPRDEKRDVGLKNRPPLTEESISRLITTPLWEPYKIDSDPEGMLSNMSADFPKKSSGFFRAQYNKILSDELYRQDLVKYYNKNINNYLYEAKFTISDFSDIDFDYGFTGLTLSNFLQDLPASFIANGRLINTSSGFTFALSHFYTISKTTNIYIPLYSSRDTILFTKDTAMSLFEDPTEMGVAGEVFSARQHSVSYKTAKDMFFTSTVLSKRKESFFHRAERISSEKLKEKLTIYTLYGWIRDQIEYRKKPIKDIQKQKNKIFLMGGDILLLEVSSNALVQLVFDLIGSEKWFGLEIFNYLGEDLLINLRPILDTIINTPDSGNFHIFINYTARLLEINDFFIVNYGSDLSVLNTRIIEKILERYSREEVTQEFNKLITNAILESHYNTSLDEKEDNYLSQRNPNFNRDRSDVEELYLLMFYISRRIENYFFCSSCNRKCTNISMPENCKSLCSQSIDVEANTAIQKASNLSCIIVVNSGDGKPLSAARAEILANMAKETHEQKISETTNSSNLPDYGEEETRLRTRVQGAEARAKAKAEEANKWTQGAEARAEARAERIEREARAREKAEREAKEAKEANAARVATERARARVLERKAEEKEIVDIVKETKHLEVQEDISSKEDENEKEKDKETKTKIVIAILIAILCLVLGIMFSMYLAHTYGGKSKSKSKNYQRF